VSLSSVKLGDVDIVTINTEPHLKVDLAADFLDCVLEGRQPRTGAREGMRDLEVLEAAYRSCERNEVVVV
jgi:predicted dehydrogenase